MESARWIIVVLWTISTLARAEEPDWAAIAIEDVEAAYAVALADHPGSVDDRNPEFPAVAEAARSAALDKARRASNEVQYRQALETFFGSFEDYHFTAYFPDDESMPAPQWAGMVGVLDGDRMVVVAAHESLQDLVGRRVLSCDGQDPASLYRQRVKPYQARPAIEASRRQYSTRVFLWTPGQFESRLENCTFEGPAGPEQRELRWDFDSDEFFRLQRRALRGSRPDTGVREVQPGRWWINASIFDPSDEEEQAAIESMVDELKAQAEAIRSAEAIVVDIRGNNGGSSAYGNMIVDAVWGEDYRLSRKPESRSYVEWRVSPGNLAHMDMLMDMITSRNFPDDVLESFGKVRTGMIEAAERGESMYRQGSDDEEADTEDAPAEPVDNPVEARVYFLTNINCGSACLDFADVMLSLENVTQVGQPTTADTQYMEVRAEEAPSGLAMFVIPVKVYRDRIRAPKQGYDPEITYEGFDWSDAAVERWVNDLIDERATP